MELSASILVGAFGKCSVWYCSVVDPNEYGRAHWVYIPGLVAGKENGMWWLKKSLCIKHYQIFGMNKKEHIPSMYQLPRNETSVNIFQFDGL